MTDRELLEAAAKAAGWEPQGMEEGLLYLYGIQDGWNPLTDDGDAFRLAVKLGLLAHPQFWHEQSVDYFLSACDGDRQDPYAATRRAIVRAAAETGKS